MYADIIVDISHENLDRTFSYRVPDSLVNQICIGDRVTVPFGRANRRISGFVLGFHEMASYDPSKLKDIISIERDSSLVESKLISLADWMHTYYGSTTVQALKTVLPIKREVKAKIERTLVLQISDEDAENYLETFEKKHQTARYRLLSELIKEKSIDYRIVTGKLNIAPTTIKTFAEMNIIDVINERVYRNSITDEKSNERVELNDEQKMAVNCFIKDYDSNIHNTYLIHGITGSGKTETYMEMIEHVIRSKRQVIVLIPEIALTYQTVMRFNRRFGERVSTLHSKLSEGEKYDQFLRAKNKEIDIMIGPRSALFTPFENIGLIVIDEEHEHTYKSDNMPKYHATQVAKELARLHNASVVLGSATPSVNSYYEACRGEYKLLELKNRAKESVLPTVSVVDLREELKDGNKSIFSRALREKIEDRLSKKEQVMIFLNRRGYLGFVSCRSCGHVIKCPHCDVSLSKHKGGVLRCHYCGYETPEVKECPECSSKLIGGMRAGTQSVEEQLNKLFPYANILRMDADTTRKKGGYEDILSRFANREADILVGTQMIVKGHDFPYVTLVGILAADMSLNASDYLAGERTFQLLVQAAGRAGRDKRPGEVIIQTYRPEHYAIDSAISQNYRMFYDKEMSYRRLMGYPPCAHILAILFESDYEKDGMNLARSLAERLNNDIISQYVKSGVMLIGPVSCQVSKISDVYRHVIYLKSEDTDVLIDAKNYSESFLKNRDDKRIRVSFDMDPLQTY